MRQAALVWSTWQRLLKPFASAFTRPSYRRFVEWVTALVLNVEEHTITQSVTAIDRLGDWKAMESFAEYAAWKPNALTRTLNLLVGEAPGRIWHGYRISAVDDTKVHRSGENVWGTCTFHEYTARCPNRAGVTHRFCIGNADPVFSSVFREVAGRGRKDREASRRYRKRTRPWMSMLRVSSMA
jgi:hypothetical protein